MNDNQKTAGECRENMPNGGRVILEDARAPELSDAGAEALTLAEDIAERESRWQRSEDRLAAAEGAAEVLEAAARKAETELSAWRVFGRGAALALGYQEGRCSEEVGVAERDFVTKELASLIGEVGRLREQHRGDVIDRHLADEQASGLLEMWRQMAVRVLVLAGEDVEELATEDVPAWVAALEDWCRRASALRSRAESERAQAQRQLSEVVEAGQVENARGLEAQRRIAELQAMVSLHRQELADWDDWALSCLGDAPEPEDEREWWREQVEEMMVALVAAERAKSEQATALELAGARELDLRLTGEEFEAREAEREPWFVGVLDARGLTVPEDPRERRAAVLALVERLEADLTASEEFGATETDRADRAEEAAALHSAACRRQEARASAAEQMWDAFIGTAQLIDRAVAELDNAVVAKRLGTSLRAIIGAMGMLDQALVQLRPALEQWVDAGGPIEERTRAGIGPGFDGTKTQVGIGPGLVPSGGRDLLDEDPPDVEPMVRDRVRGVVGAGGLVHTYRDDRARRVWEAAQPVGGAGDPLRAPDRHSWAMGPSASELDPNHCTGERVFKGSGEGSATAQGLRQVQDERSDRVSGVQCGAGTGGRPEKRSVFGENSKHFGRLAGDNLLCAEGRTFGEESRSSCEQAVSGRENSGGCQNKATPATFGAVRLAVRGLVRLVGRLARGGVA